uniref:Maturase n=1 Tax=Euglena viridis TaxID=3040 RepID=A0A0B5GPB9_EUGVI|nr:maturase [Euglena viridis]AJF21611.1 maturase [Euglena viridis]
MIDNNSMVLKLFTSEFLLFSWNDLKNNKNFYLNFQNSKKNFYPISKLWFIRVSTLIQSGRFLYKTKKKKKFLFMSNKKKIHNIKIQILENAFLLIMQPYFLNNIFLKFLIFLNFSFNLVNFSHYFLAKNNEKNSNKFNKIVDINNKSCFTQVGLSIHFSVSVIRSWNPNLNFILSSQIIKSFDLINKNRLKNIILKTFKDNILWVEIEKMFVSHILDFSRSHIYQGSNNSTFSLLSHFLFNIYLNELDYYVFDLINKYNFNKKLFSNGIKSLTSFEVLLKQYTPIKLEKRLNNFKNIKVFNIEKYNSFGRFYSDSFLNNILFDKSIEYIRFLDYFIIGFVGSKNFVCGIQNKLTNFLKSSLHFDIKNLNLYLIHDSIYFGGYNIRLCNLNKLNYQFLSKLKSNKKYIPKILVRLDLSRKKISKKFIKRLQSELFLHVERIYINNGFIPSFKDRRIWTHIFQLEAVRSTQFGKLLITKDQYSIVSNKLIAEVINIQIFEYQKYSFNLYVLKLQVALKEVFNTFPSVISNSILPFDLEFNNFLSEFRKRLFFFYNNFYFKKNSSNNLIKNNFFELCNFNKLEIFNFKKEFSNTKQQFSKIFYLEIFFDTNYSLKRLRTLGLFHNVKARPIGNSKLLYFQDAYIIKYYGYIAFVFLNWFRCCYNFNKVVQFIEIIRQSCFLTLSRKHNKSKAWSYRLYSSDLIFLRSFCNSLSFFPTKFALSKTKKKFFFFKKDLYFDEDFFLSEILVIYLLNL